MSQQELPPSETPETVPETQEAPRLVASDYDRASVEEAPITPSSSVADREGRDAVGTQQNEQNVNDEWGDEDGEFELEEEMLSSAQAGQQSLSGVSATAESPKKRRGRPPNSARKRKLEEAQHEPTDQQDWKPKEDGGDDEDDAEKISKFGRKIQRPSSFMPITKTPPSQKRPYIRRTIPGQIICKVCHKGNSPKGNRIVLCDNCDTPYHQQCHNPAVEDIIVGLPDAKWFCSQCEKGRGKIKVEKEISGRELSIDQKKAFLLSLPKGSLMDLVLYADKMHPDLKMYPAYLKEDAERAAAAAAAGIQSISNFGSLPYRNFGNYVTSPPSEPSQSVGKDFELTEGEDIPSYEDMIVKAIVALAEPKGSAPKDIWNWMTSNFPLAENFSRSASQSLQKSTKKGRFVKEGNLYKLNPNYIPDPRMRKSARKPSLIRPFAASGPQLKQPSADSDTSQSQAIVSSQKHGSEVTHNHPATDSTQNHFAPSFGVPEPQPINIDFDFREGASSQLHANGTSQHPPADSTGIGQTFVDSDHTVLKSHAPLPPMGVVLPQAVPNGFGGPTAPFGIRDGQTQ